MNLSDEIPLTVAALERILEDGVHKHGRGNWRLLGRVPLAQKHTRHLEATLDGDATSGVVGAWGAAVDADSGELHLARAAANLLLLCELALEKKRGELSKQQTLPWKTSTLVAGELRRPAKSGDVGHDLVISGDHMLRPGIMSHLPTRCRVLGGDYAYFILPRSSATKRGIDVAIGTIDCGYTGPLFVAATVRGVEAVQVKDGERIAQLVFFRPVTPEIVEVDEFPETERGDAGFGSTGVR